MSPESRIVELSRRECQLDLKKLEHIATPLNQLAIEWQLLGSLQKY